MASSHSLEHNSPLSAESFTLYSFMDEVESRVEALRRQANSLIQEQASLLMVMDHLKEESLRSLITPGDCQELIANIERLRERCQAVEVHVHTVRDEGQIKALDKINMVLQDLESQVNGNPTVTLSVSQRAHSCLNACLPEAVGAIDTRFQSLVLGCALDDQKKVRWRLESLVKHCSNRQYLTSERQLSGCQDTTIMQQDTTAASMSNRTISDDFNTHCYISHTGTSPPTPQPSAFNEKFYDEGQSDVPCGQNLMRQVDSAFSLPQNNFYTETFHAKQNN